MAELGVDVFDQYLAGDAMYHDRPRSQRMSGNPLDVPSGRFRRGADALAEGLAGQLPEGVVQLGCVVRSVQTSTAGAVVAHDGGEVTADHVVLALPPALARHAITFDPGLPQALDGLAALTPVWMGAIAKVVVVYPEPFWRDDGLAGAAISHLGPMRELHDLSGPEGAPAALFGFAPVDDGRSAPTETAVIAQLVELFGPSAEQPLQVLIRDWSAEPFTSRPDVGSQKNYRTYGHPAYQVPAGDGRLHWASTETSPVAPGHMEGALAAAERTVTTIASSPPSGV